MNGNDISRDQWMLTGPLASKGYDWWWHSFTAEKENTGERKPFYVGYGASRPLRKVNAFEMFWHAEGMETLIDEIIAEEIGCEYGEY